MISTVTNEKIESHAWHSKGLRMSVKSELLFQKQLVIENE